MSAVPFTDAHRQRLVPAQKATLRGMRSEAPTTVGLPTKYDGAYCSYRDGALCLSERIHRVFANGKF
jgi:hypothetical protein